MSALILLSGCQYYSRNYQPRIYTSVTECYEDGIYSRNVCLHQFQKAIQFNQNNAPQFKQKEDCEKTYGAENCQFYAANGYRYYRPLMRGYVVGNEKNNQPIYGSSSRGYRSSSGVDLGKQSQTTISPSKLGKSSPKGSVTRGSYGKGGSRGSGGKGS